MSAHDDLLEHGLSVYEAANVLEKHAHELAEKIRHGGVRYDLRAFNAAQAAGSGRVLKFVQSAIADAIDPEMADD